MDAGRNTLPTADYFFTALIFDLVERDFAHGAEQADAA